jgi:hypothetical protein
MHGQLWLCLILEKSIMENLTNKNQNVNRKAKIGRETSQGPKMIANV